MGKRVSRSVTAVERERGEKANHIVLEKGSESRTGSENQLESEQKKISKEVRESDGHVRGGGGVSK